MDFTISGYVPPRRRANPVITLMKDFVDLELVEFLKSLISKYSKIGFIEGRCGYGCSDHASWTKAGFRSVFPIEAPMKELSPYIHSPKDEVKYVDFANMVEFGKVILSFAVELSHIA